MEKLYRMTNDRKKKTVEVTKGAVEAYKTARWRVLEDEYKSKSNTKKTTSK